MCVCFLIGNVLLDSTCDFVCFRSTFIYLVKIHLSSCKFSTFLIGMANVSLMGEEEFCDCLSVLLVCVFIYIVRKLRLSILSINKSTQIFNTHRQIVSKARI